MTSSQPDNALNISEQSLRINGYPSQDASPATSKLGIELDPAEAKKITQLKNKIAHLEQRIRVTEAQKAEVTSKLRTNDPRALVDRHIKQLHQYNEIRDVGQGLMGIIAEQRGVRVVDVYEEFGVGNGD